MRGCDMTVIPIRPITITVHVLFYGMACTLLTALCLAAAAAWLAWSATQDLRHLQEDLLTARATSRACRIALERADAKLEVVDEWILGAHKLRGP